MTTDRRSCQTGDQCQSTNCGHGPDSEPSGGDGLEPGRERGDGTVKVDHEHSVSLANRLGIGAETKCNAIAPKSQTRKGRM